MAIDIYNRYGPRANPSDSNYPYGSIKNESIPTADDGTPLEKDWGNDISGFHQKLLLEGGVTPSGSPDTVLSSDYYDSLQNVLQRSGGKPFATVAALKADTTVKVGDFVTVSNDHRGLVSYNIVSAANAVSDKMYAGYRNPEVLSGDVAVLASENKGKASRIKNRLEEDFTDLYVINHGDSTSDSDLEFFKQMAEMLSVKYPSYTFKYVSWIHASTSWGAPTTISTGTGVNTIYFYNGSFAGATHGYWAGARMSKAFDNKTMDVIITNYGLNVPTEKRHQEAQLAEWLLTLKQVQPSAEILVTIQPPDYNLLDRSSNRMDAQRMVAGLYGCRIINAYDLFLKLVASTGGVRTGWYLDDIHPTAAGAREWAMIAVDAFEYDNADSSASPKGFESTPSNVPNGFFNSWLKGVSAAPSLWNSTSATVRDSVNKETYGGGARCEGVGTGTGVLRLQEATDFIKRYRHWGQIVVAARIYTQGGFSGKCGLLYAAHSISTSYTEIQSSQAPAQNVDYGYRWAILKIDSDFLSNDDFHLGVLSGELGEVVTVDRIVISPTLMIRDIDIDQSYSYSAVVADSSHTVTANSQTERTFSVFSSTFPIVAGCHVEFSATTPSSGVTVSVYCLTDGVLVMRFVNSSGSDATVAATNYNLKMTAPVTTQP